MIGSKHNRLIAAGLALAFMAVAIPASAEVTSSYGQTGTGLAVTNAVFTQNTAVQEEQAFASNGNAAAVIPVADRFFQGCWWRRDRWGRWYRVSGPVYVYPRHYGYYYRPYRYHRDWDDFHYRRWRDRDWR